MTRGSTIPSTNISLNKIRSTQEYEGLLQLDESSLTTNSTRLLATRPYSGSTNVVLDNATPHAMSEFNGYKAPWPEIDSSVTYNKINLYNQGVSSSNWVLSGAGFEFSMTRSNVGDIDTVSFYADATSGQYMGVAKDSGSFTNVTTSGDVYLGRVRYRNSTSVPDSYYVKVTNGSWSGGFTLQLDTTYTNGTQSYEMNPPNTVYTFWNQAAWPGTVYYFPTGFNFATIAQDECSSFSINRNSTFSVIFKKSGYADQEVFSFTLNEELDGIWTGGMCN